MHAPAVAAQNWRWARFLQDEKRCDENAELHASFFVDVTREWQSRTQSSVELFARVRAEEIFVLQYFLARWERGRCKAQGEPMMEARGRTPAVPRCRPYGAHSRSDVNPALTRWAKLCRRCAAPSCLPPRGSIVPGAARLHRARRCAAPSCPALRGSIVPGAARLHRARALRDSIVPGSWPWACRCGSIVLGAARLHRAALRGSIVPGRCAAPSCLALRAPSRPCAGPVAWAIAEFAGCGCLRGVAMACSPRLPGLGRVIYTHCLPLGH